MIKITVRIILPLIISLYLASCGSSPGGNTTIVTGPGSSPNPQPIDYNTVEYRKNYGLPLINAISAYENGATGKDITIAVIDSGIDIDHSQIEANIHVDSTNIVTGNKADLNDIDGQGTAVAGIIAAIRDPANNSNNNFHGVAFDAKIMAINSASVGSCSSINGCSFSDNDIAAALDYARLRGVKVVNISTSNNGFISQTLIDAYKQAVDAGMVIILAAGDREGSDTDSSVARPENSASVAWADWANGQIIVAGAVGQSSIITDLSHRAGSIAKTVFLVAAGERVPSLGANGTFLFWDGTSFSTPYISGAVALLMDAFPNLTGKQVVDLLFSTATDLGDIGTDAVYGQGLVNLTEAFRPQGVTSIAVKTAAGETKVITMKGSALLGGEAFGGFTALSLGLSDSMMLDGFDRSFRVDLGQNIFSQNDTIKLESLIGSTRGNRTSSLPFSPSAQIKISWIEDWRFQEVDKQYFSHQDTARNRNRDLRMKLDLSLNPDQTMTIAQGLSMKEAMEDYNQNEFLSIGKEDFMALIGRGDSQSAVISQKLGIGSRITLAMGHGGREWQQYNLKADNYIMIARIEHSLSAPIKFGLDFGLMSERASVLGSLSSGAISLGKGATTTFVNARFDWALADKVALFTRASYGVTDVKAADLSLIQKINNLTSASFSMGLTGHSLFQRGDRLSFAVSQPLRVMGGEANISYVTNRDYQADTLSFVDRNISLAPDGREIDFELAYRIADIFGARVDLNVLHQINPNHNRTNPDNTGVLVRLGSEF